MYHRVIDLPYDPWKLCVSGKHFEEHMLIIKKYAAAVQIGELADSLPSFSLGRKKIAVTFDDGYADNYYNAAPILKRHAVSATFYITTGATDSQQEFWWDEISRLILEPASLPATFQLTTGQTHYTWAIDSTKATIMTKNDPIPEQIPPNNSILSKTQLYFAVWRIISSLSTTEKSETLKKVALWSGSKPEARDNYRAMTTKELTDLSSSYLFEIGAHTVRHPMLAQLNFSEQKEEIVESKNFLEKMYKKKIISFAYPHGSYNENTLKLMKETGFKNACTTEERPVTRKTDPYRLPRFMVLDWTGKEFEQKLQYWINSDE